MPTQAPRLFRPNENTVPDLKNPENPIPLTTFYVSHDGRAMLPTINTMVQIARELGRPRLSLTTNGLGQAVAINGMMESFKHIIKEKSPQSDGIINNGIVRALWVEDDIRLDQGQAKEIAEMITEADKHGWNIVTPYATGFSQITDDGFNWVYFKKPNPKTGEIGRPLLSEEIRSLKPFDEFDGLAGLGFYYGDIVVDYVWYEGTFNGMDRFGLPSYSGIDWNYFLDNDIKLRHYPVNIIHEKTVEFSNAPVIPMLKNIPQLWAGLQNANPQ